MSKENNDLSLELKQIYTLVSSLLVSGDSVDIVAAIRLRLRKLYEEAAENADS